MDLWGYDFASSMSTAEIAYNDNDVPDGDADAAMLEKGGSSFEELELDRPSVTHSISREFARPT